MKNKGKDSCGSEKIVLRLNGYEVRDFAQKDFFLLLKTQAIPKTKVITQIAPIVVEILYVPEFGT